MLLLLWGQAAGTWWEGGPALPTGSTSTFFLVRAAGHGLLSMHQWREQGAAGRALAAAQFGFHPLSTGGRGCNGLTGMVQGFLIFKAFETTCFVGNNIVSLRKGLQTSIARPVWGAMKV